MTATPCSRVTKRQLHSRERCLCQRQQAAYRDSQASRLHATSRVMDTILLKAERESCEHSSSVSEG